MLTAAPLRNIGGLRADLSSKFMADLAKRQRWRYAKNIIEGTSILTPTNAIPAAPKNLTQPAPDFDTFTARAKKNLLDRLSDIETRAAQDKSIPEKEIQESFIWAGTNLYASSEDEFFLVRKLVAIPFRIFSAKALEFGISIWVWIARARPSVHHRLFAEISKCWEWALRRHKGLFNVNLKYRPPADGISFLFLCYFSILGLVLTIASLIPL
jgi:PI4-kinase N-terminal region